MCSRCSPAAAEQGGGLIVRQSTSAARDSRGYTKAFPQATTAAEFPASVSDALALDSLLSPEEREIRRRVRAFAENEVAPVITGRRATSQDLTAAAEPS
jgi:hypothetical protein